MALAKDAAGRTLVDHVEPSGGWRAHATGARRRDSPPAQGGKQTLGAAPVPQIQEQIVDVEAPVVDVLVTMLHKFQQPYEFDILKVPQIQFIDRVLDIPVMPQRDKLCRKRDTPQVQCLGRC